MRKFKQDTTLPGGFSITFRERFWSKVEKTDTCWNWIAFRNKKGYGEIAIKHEGRQKSIVSSRASWILHNGEIPEGFWALHKCDNPACVNPDHIYLGTVVENTKDACERNRVRKGESHYRCKLSNENVKRIIEMCEIGEQSQTQIANLFSVGQDHVSRIVNKKRRRHV